MMDLSFNLEQFLKLLQNYNLAIWPLQVIAYLLGAAALLLTALKTRYSGRIVAAILAFFWLWTGGVFNLFYFRPFYPLAIVFVFLFIIQGIIFAVAATGPDGLRRRGKPQLSFSFQHNARTFIAKLLALYALVGYPLLEMLLGRGYPRTLPFGLVPCPTTIFTLAILLLADKKLPWYVFAIPVCYSFSGVVPIASGIYEDVGLVAAGVIAMFFLLRQGANPENR